MRLVFRPVAAAAAVLVLGLGSATSVAADNPQELDRTYLKAGVGPRELARMVRCLVDRRPDAAKALFDHPLGSTSYSEAQAAFFGEAGECLALTSRLRTSSIMGRGAVAERLLELDGLLGVVIPPVAPALQGGGTYSWNWRNLSDAGIQRNVWLADCLVARHGNRAQELLATRLSSLPERAVFNAMSAELTDCVPAGERWTLNPYILRKAIAFTYYLTARTLASAGRAAAA